MTDLLVSLLGGVILISIVFLLLHRLSRLNGKSTAMVMALIVTGLYVPYSILFWPGGDVFAIHIAIYLVSVYVLGIIVSAREASKHEGGKHFHWGPALIIMFFMVVIGVDSVFIMVAQQGVNSDVFRWLFPEPRSGAKVSSHFSGTVTHDYRQREEEFNRYQERLAEQEKRNWTINKGWLNPPVVNESAIFKIALFDENSQPIDQAEVYGKFLRPGNVKLDQEYQMQEVAPGEYQVAVTLPVPGRWMMQVTIHKDDIFHEMMAWTEVETSQP